MSCWQERGHSHGCREPVSFVAVLCGRAWSGVWRLAFELVLMLVCVRVLVRMLVRMLAWGFQ